MGRERSKLELKLIENERQSRRTHQKRKEGLKKKAYELATLCAVDVAFLSFDEAGRVDTWPNDPRLVRDTIDRFLGGSGRTGPGPQREEAEAVDSRLDSVRESLRMLQPTTGGVLDSDRPLDPTAAFVDPCDPLDPVSAFLDWDLECMISDFIDAADFVDDADPIAFAQPLPLQPTQSINGGDCSSM